MDPRRFPRYIQRTPNCKPGKAPQKNGHKLALESQLMDLYLTESDRAQLQSQEPFVLKPLPAPTYLKKLFHMNTPYKPYDPSTLAKKNSDSALTCLIKQVDLMETTSVEDRIEKRRKMDMRRQMQLMNEEPPIQKKIRKNVGEETKPSLAKHEQKDKSSAVIKTAAMKRDDLGRKATEVFNRVMEDQKRQEQRKKFGQDEQKSERNHLQQKPTSVPQLPPGYDIFQLHQIERKRFPTGGFTIDKKEIETIQKGLQQMQRKQEEQERKKRLNVQQYINLDDD